MLAGTPAEADVDEEDTGLGEAVLEVDVEDRTGCEAAVEGEGVEALAGAAAGVVRFLGGIVGIGS